MFQSYTMGHGGGGNLQREGREKEWVKEKTTQFRTMQMNSQTGRLV